MHRVYKIVSLRPGSGQESAKPGAILVYTAMLWPCSSGESGTIGPGGAAILLLLPTKSVTALQVAEAHGLTLSSTALAASAHAEMTSERTPS